MTTLQTDAFALAAQGIVKGFMGIQAINGLDIEIPRGRITGIIGPNGAGKSTLLNVLSGLIRPEQGKIFMENREVTGHPPHKMAQQGLMRTFQMSRELGQLTVLENMLLASPRQAGENIFAALFRPGQVRRERSVAIERARERLEMVGLWPLANELAAELSGGQKKLLELARALMAEPSIIMLDEPAAGVNPSLIRDLLAIIQDLRDNGLTFVIVEHNMDVVAGICNPVHVMSEGRSLARGTFDEILGNERVIEAYLGAV